MLRLFAVLILILGSSQAVAEPPRWDVDMTKSRLGFVAYWQASPVKGEFKVWRADIRFDPDDLAASEVRVEIETGSADSNYSDRDSAIKGPEWFAIEAFPTAVFTAKSFRRLENEQYETQGILRVKGINQHVTLLFTLALQDGHAIMTAEAPLSRLAFNVGEGQWRDTSFIKDEVIVEIELHADKGG